MQSLYHTLIMSRTGSLSEGTFGILCLSIANFCEFKKVQEWTFPETLIGWAAYSQEECPPDTASGMVASQLLE